ncbi:MAG: EVE domain-containing protein [Gemmatimonadota bacterium]
MPGCWLVKTEPGTYSIDDLERDGSTEWSGVRNYAARNLMRDEMRHGDLVLVYHSSTDVLGVYGVARVAGEAHPDSTQFDPRSDYHDPDSARDDPRWWCVDLAHVETFPGPVTRDAMKEEPALHAMKVLQRGVRLSVMPVTKEEFETVRRMAER